MAVIVMILEIAFSASVKKDTKDEHALKLSAIAIQVHVKMVEPACQWHIHTHAFVVLDFMEMSVSNVSNNIFF